MSHLGGGTRRQGARLWAMVVAGAAVAFAGLVDAPSSASPFARPRPAVAGANVVRPRPVGSTASVVQPRVMYDSQQSPAGLWTRNPDGSNPQSFYAGGFWSSWSANGAKVAFDTDPSGCFFGSSVGTIDVMNADGSGLTLVAQGCEPRISPDGTKVVYQPEANAVDVIGTAPGSQPVELVNFNVDHSNSGCDSQPSFSDHDLLADCYSAENPGWLGNATVIYDGGLGLALWQVPAAGGPAQEVPGTDQSSSGIAWLNGVAGSYDGSTYAAAGSKCGSLGCTSGIFVGLQEVVTAQLGASEGDLADPQWSFDDKSLVYEASGSSGSSSVYTATSSGAAQTLVTGSDMTAANPSFAPPPEPGTISGAVTGKNNAPLGGVTITATPVSGGSPITVTTASNGSYSAQVSATTYTLTASGTPPGQQAGGHYRVTACSGTAASSSCTVDVAPGQTSTASFSYGSLQLSGTVAFAGTRDPVQHMAVTIAGNGTSATVQTDAGGQYSVNLGPGTYTVTADPAYRPTAVASADCQASGGTCTVNLNQDRVANFTVQCQPTLDFHTSMIAKGCFVPVDVAAGTWRAKGQFRMDGIDFQAQDDVSDPVTFNDKQKTVDGDHVKMSLSAPGWGGGWMAFSVPLHLSFPFTQEQHTLALTTPWATPGSLAMKGIGYLTAGLGGSSTIFGFPAHAPAAELDFTPGQTTLKLQLSFPRQSGAFLDPVNGLWKVPTANGGTRITYPIAVRATIIASNSTGVSEIDGSFSPSAAYGIDTQANQFVRSTGPPPLGTVELARIGFNWHLSQGGFDATALLVVHNNPSNAAREWVKPLAGFLGKTLVSVDLGFKWLTTAQVFGHTFPIPGLTSLSVQVNNINQYIEGTPGLFWQRLGLNGGIDVTNPLGAVRLGANVGFTWLPRFKSDYLWFQEVASLDGGGELTFDPFSFSGSAALKALNATLVSGAMKLNHDGLYLQGTAGLNLDQLLRVGFPAAIQGTGSLSLPTTGDTFLGNWQLLVDGKVNVWTLVADGKLAMNATGAGLCVTSSDFGTKGVYFDGAWHVGGCNTAPFGPAASAGVTMNAARSSHGDALAGPSPTSFVIGPHAQVSEVAVRGLGAAPQVTLSGPGGLSLTATSTAPADITPAGGLVMNPSDDTTYVLFSHARPGRYEVTPVGGTGGIGEVQFARPLPPPSVSAHVTTDGCQAELRWHVVPEPGQRVIFEERSSAGEQQLVSTDAPTGKHALVPSTGAGNDRAVVALVEQQGTPREQLVVARYRAPSGTGRVVGLHAERISRKVILTWAPVCGASYYYVTVGKGARSTATTTTRTRLVVRIGQRRHVVVGVRAVNLSGQGGRATQLKVPA